jgi:hypothetical protein
MCNWSLFFLSSYILGNDEAYLKFTPCGWEKVMSDDLRHRNIDGQTTFNRTKYAEGLKTQIHSRHAPRPLGWTWFILDL